MVTFANNLLARGGDIPNVPSEVVVSLAYVEKKLREEINGLNKNHSKKPPLKPARVFLNRQRASEKSLASHLDQGTVISGSLHVCTDDIMGVASTPSPVKAKHCSGLKG